MGQKVEVTPIKVRYSEVMNFDLANALQKIASNDTSNKNACHIYKIVRAIEAARKVVGDAFKTEFVDKYAPKDESGKPEISPEGGFVVDAEQKSEFDVAEKEFGERTFEIKWRPLNPSVLCDVKLSARDIKALGPLFDEDDSGRPEVPHLQSI